MPARPAHALRRRVSIIGVAAVMLLAGCTATAAPDEAADAPVPSASSDAATAAPTETAGPAPSPSPTASSGTQDPDEPTADAAPYTGGGTGSGGSGSGSSQGGESSSGSDSGSARSGRDSGSTGGTDVDPGADIDPEEAITYSDSVQVISEVGQLDFSWNGAYSGDDFAYDSQDWDSGDNTLTIDVDGTHEQSDTPADWFNSQTNGNATNTDASSDTEPDELHYAFCGTLTFDDYEDANANTCFGQGESGVHNNWWVGGALYQSDQTCIIDPDATDSGATSLVACASGGLADSYQFEMDAGGTHPNYLSLYSPDTSYPLDPKKIGTNIEDYIEANDANLTEKDKAALTAVVAALPDVDFDTPSLWSVDCDDNCMDASEYTITSGQLWAGLHDTTSYPGILWTQGLDEKNVNNYSTNATAGRNKSSDAANWFIDQVGDGGMVGAGVNDGTTQPGDLNFAYCGDLTPSGGTATAGIPLCFGQGNNKDDGNSNNWWIGGSEWSVMDTTSTDALASFLPVDDFGVLGSIDVRVLLNEKHATAVIVATGNALAGAVDDGFAFVVGLG